MREGLAENKRFCECGCGGIPLGSYYVKGKGLVLSKYIHGHNQKGKRSPNSALKKENNPNWQGGRRITKSGYVLIRIDNHLRGKYVFEHILVYENYYQCCILSSGVIHHINGIRNDNRIENLELMGRGKHSTHHHLGTTWFLYSSKRHIEYSKRLFKWLFNEYDGRTFRWRKI